MLLAIILLIIVVAILGFKRTLGAIGALFLFVVGIGLVFLWLLSTLMG